MRRLRRYPAVALVGPRQVGKTTLARSLEGIYFDLETDADRTRIDVEWTRICESRQLVVLDEAQTHPEVFPRLRSAIDQQRSRNGRFLLLGSVSPALMRDVSESLAGRLAVLELTPFLVGEVGSARMRDLWLHGGYPDAGYLDASAYPAWGEDYLALLAQRDLPAWGLAAKPSLTSRLFRMLAAVHGQEWNASALGSSLGISYHTVNSYLDSLEGAFLIRRLQPYQTNIKKRLVKRPRVYWRDSGLVHALMKTRSWDQLLVQPWVGSSWEGFVIEQAIATARTGGVQFEPYFLRTSDGREIDLVLDFGNELWAIEIKLTTNPSPDQLRRTEDISKIIGADRVFLVSQVPRSSVAEKLASCNLPRFLTELGKQA